MSDETPAHCAWLGCQNPAEVEIANRPLCPPHFYQVAQRRMSSLLGVLSDTDADRRLPPDVQRFLSELVDETTQLAAEAKQENSAVIEELLKLSVAAAELSKKIRRPARWRRQVQVAVQPSASAPTVKEECTTLNIGRFGGCIETSLPLRAGQKIFVKRLDNRATASARVVWVRDSSPSKTLAGFMLSGEDNFWGISEPPSLR